MQALFWTVLVVLTATSEGQSEDNETKTICLPGIAGDGAITATTASEFNKYSLCDTTLTVLIKLKATEAEEGARADVSVTSVVDRSSSMRGTKIGLLKSTNQFFIDELKQEDLFGLVSFSSSAREDVPLTKLTDEAKINITEVIDKIEADGNTNIEAALVEGIRQQKDSPLESKFILLFTDGQPTAGARTTPEIEATLMEELEIPSRPVVYTLGFGGDQDVELLQRIADIGKGIYVFISDENEIAPTFGRILGGLISVSAQDIEVLVTPFNYANITSIKAGGVVEPGNPWRITFTDLFATEERDIIVKMQLPETDILGRLMVLLVEISYFDPVNGQKVVLAPLISAVNIVAPRELDKTPNRNVELANLRVRVAEDIKEAVNQKQNNQQEQALKILDETINTLESSELASSDRVQLFIKDVRMIREVLSSSKALTVLEEANITAGTDALLSQRSFGPTALESSDRYIVAGNLGDRASSAIEGNG